MEINLIIITTITITVTNHYQSLVQKGWQCKKCNILDFPPFQGCFSTWVDAKKRTPEFSIQQLLMSACFGRVIKPCSQTTMEWRFKFELNLKFSRLPLWSKVGSKAQGRTVCSMWLPQGRSARGPRYNWQCWIIHEQVYTHSWKYIVLACTSVCTRGPVCLFQRRQTHRVIFRTTTPSLCAKLIWQNVFVQKRNPRPTPDVPELLGKPKP